MQILVCSAVSSLDSGWRQEARLGRTVEQTVGQRTANPFVEEDEKKSDLVAFLGEAVGVSLPVALDQAVGSELAQVVAHLVERVGSRLKREGGEDSLANVWGPPSADLSTGMKEHFHEPNHAGVVDLDAGDFRTAHDDGQGHSLKEWEIDVNVERFGFEAGEPIGYRGEGLADGGQVVERLA